MPIVPLASLHVTIGLWVCILLIIKPVNQYATSVPCLEGVGINYCTQDVVLVNWWSLDSYKHAMVSANFTIPHAQCWPCCFRSMSAFRQTRKKTSPFLTHKLQVRGNKTYPPLFVSLNGGHFHQLPNCSWYIWDAKLANPCIKFIVLWIFIWTVLLLQPLAPLTSHLLWIVLELP